MEGELLSLRPPDRKDAGVLRDAFSDCRDQLHVLSHADAEARGRLGGTSARELPVHAQGAAPNYARQATPPRRRERVAAGLCDRGGRARTTAWRAAVSVAADVQEG